MAKNGKILEKDIVEKQVYDIGQKYAKGLDPAINANKEWLKSFEDLKKSALAYNEVSKGFKQVGGRKDFISQKQKEVKLTEQATVAFKEQQRIELQLIKTKERNSIASESTSRALSKEKVRAQAVAAANKLQAREQLGLVGAYEKLNRKRNQAQTTLANLLAADKRNVAQIKKAQAEYNRLDARVKAVDASTKNFTKNIGNYKSAIGGLTGTFRSLVSALGLAGGAFMFIRVIKNGINIIKDFEKQNATLSAILQVESDQMVALREDAQRLGAQTVKTAGQVTGLQIAYARLGFSQQQILDLTEATIQGSIAMNAELDKTAELTGAVVNTFDDFSATDAPEIMDVMALATAKSALNFQKLETGIPIVAGAANAAGVPFTKLIALMGKLSDSGIDISSSSTALRNIFIESAAQGLSYEQILEKIKGSTDKLTASNDEFGKRAAVSASILANNIEKTDDLDEALQNAAGTAERMANKELDTLDGALQLLTSAWQGVILETDEANGVTDKIKKSIQFLANNLKTIIKVIGYVTGAWLLYKGVLIAISISTRIYVAAVNVLRIAKIALAGGINNATRAMKLFNIATKANPIGFLVGLLTAAAVAWLAFRDGVKSTVEQLKEVRKAAEDARDAVVQTNIEIVKAKLDAIDNDIANETTATKKKIDLINEEIEAQKNGSKIIEEINEEARKKDLKAEEEKAKKIAELNAKLGEQLKGKGKSQKDERALGVKTPTASTAPIIIDVKPVLTETAQEKTVKELEKLLDSLQDKQKKAAKELSEKLIAQIRKDAFELKKAQIQSEIDANKEIIDNEKSTLAEKQRANIDYYEGKKELLDVIKAFEIAENQGRTDKIKQIELEYNDELKKIQQDRFNNGMEFLKKDFELRVKAIEDAKKLKEASLQNELAGAADTFNSSGKSTADAEAYEKAVADIKKRYALETVQVQIDAVNKLLAQEGFSKEQRELLAAQLKDLKIAYSDIETGHVLENLQKQKEAEEKLKQFREASFKNLSDGLATALDISGEHLTSFLDNFKAMFDDTLEGFGEGLVGTLEGIKAAAQVVGDIMGSVYRQNIDNLEEQLDKSNEYYDRQYELAEGNARQQDLIREEQRKKELQLKKKIAEEKTKAAKAEKAAALVQAGINTALAITAALTQDPPASYVMAALSAALGLAQIAIIASKPIPKFKDGHLAGTHEGWAITNDGGRDEVHERNGKATIIKGRNVPIFMKKGDKIHKSVDDYKQLMRASILASVEIENKKLNDFQSKQVFDGYSEEMLQEIKELNASFKNQKQPIHFHERKIDINHAIWRSNRIRWD